MKKHIALALAIFPALALAQQTQGNGLTYNYAGIGYGALNFNDSGVKANFSGFGLEAGALVTENVFLVGSYTSASANKFTLSGTSYAITMDIDQTNVGIGYRIPLSAGTDLTGSVGYARGTVKTTGVGSTTATSYPVSVGIRSLLNESVQAGASGTVADGDFSAGAFVQYKVVNNVGLVGSVSSQSSGTGYTLSVRYLF